jgi:fatty acid desaturase
MKRIFNFYFINYFNFFLGNNRNERFAVTKAINLIAVNILFLNLTILIFLTHLFPESQRFGVPCLIIVGVGLLGIYLQVKKFKKLSVNLENPESVLVNSKSKIIVWATPVLIFTCFVILLISIGHFSNTN